MNLRGCFWLVQQILWQNPAIFTVNSVGVMCLWWSTGSFEILRHHQVAKDFAMDKRLRLEKPGWRVLDFNGNRLTDDEAECQYAQIMRTPFVRCDREYPFCENLITDDAGVVDLQLPILAKVSSLLEILRLGGSYEVVDQLWAQFSPTASCVNVEVCWSRNEVLVSIRIFSVSYTHLAPENYESVPKKHVVSPNFHDWCSVCSPSCWMECTHGSWCGLWTGWSRVASSVLSLREETESTLVFVRRWDRDTFRRVCVALLCKYTGDASREAAVLGQLMSVVGPLASLVALLGGSHMLHYTYVEFDGSSYREKLVEYPMFDLQLLKRCLQKCASVVFGSLDQFLMTEVIIVRLKAAEHRNWMASRHAMRRAVVSRDRSKPSLVGVVGNTVGYWPLIVSFLKETRRNTDGDSLVVKYSSIVSFRIQIRTW